MSAKRWMQVKTQILKCRIPHTVMSWRFLLPNQSRAVQLHRKVFLGAWPSLPRWQWALIALYSAVTWLLFFSWQQVYFCMKNRRRKVSEEFSIPVGQQLFDLLVLTLLHGIPPRYYYLYSLHQRPRKQWLDFIYDHELPHWHQVLSAGVSEKTLHLMRDKKAFAEFMTRQGIAAIQTCDFFGRGGQIDATHIFQQQSVYLKPNSGSRGEGNVVLSFNAETGLYQLLTDEIIEIQDEIIAEINRRVGEQDYLLQPLLQNHEQIGELCDSSKLVVLRLITGVIKGKTNALFAKLEIPCTDDKKGCWAFAIDLATGQLSNWHEQEHEEFQKLKQRLDGKTLPFWQEAVDICQKSHTHFLDLPTIGWDVVFTDSGVKLLEGNINWGIAGHQFLSDEPLLNTLLAEVYP